MAKLSQHIVTRDDGGFDRGWGSAYHCAPMLTSRLPSRVEPYKLAAHGEHLEGLAALADMLGLPRKSASNSGMLRYG